MLATQDNLQSYLQPHLRVEYPTNGDDQMTDLLEQAFAQAAKLPPEQQNAIADWLLKELEAENRWDRAFAQSQDALSKLGSEAVAEHRQGDSQELDPDKL